MRKLLPVLVAVLAFAACSHVRHGVQQNVQSSPVTSAAASARPSSAPTSAFSDLQGVEQAPYIDQLAQLQVFFPSGGAFLPNRPVQRREFVRWLVQADEAIWLQNPQAALALSHTDARASFTDVPSDDPDFTAIEGLRDAGIPLAAGRQFHPNAFITREDALTIKAYVDCGAPDPIVAGDALQAYAELPAWKDKMRISRDDVAAIASCLLQDQGTTPDHQLNTIGRTFGNIDHLDPQALLTRAQAAAMIWNVGQQKPDLTNFPPRSAADALATRATSSPGN